jgi:hypothetical protein
MEGASGVLALVLAETAAGSAAVLWSARLWGAVKRGFFVLTTAVALACGLLATLAAAGGRDPAVGVGGEAAVVLLSSVSVALAVSLVALILRRGGVGRVAGLASIPMGAAALVTLGSLAETSLPVAVIQLLSGAAFMGAVTVGLLLGHWYLVDRGLARDHIQRLAVVLIGAVAVQAAVVLVAGLLEDVAPTPGFSPFLTVGGPGVWLTIVLGMVAITGLIAILTRASLREQTPRAVQAATGFFYLAVITAFTAELAAKVRFLG